MAISYRNKGAVANIALPPSADFQHVVMPSVISLTKTVEQPGLLDENLGISLEVPHFKKIKELSHR